MKKILITDDEPHVSLLLKQFLERAGYSVSTALNGEQALACLAEQIPDVLITDVQMPKMSGLELCETIAGRYPEFGPFIILMTSRTDRDIRLWVEQHSQIMLMEKPLSMRRLALQLSQHFEALGSCNL
ncbi:putative Response regulator receiver protein [Crenothrix polyspora]|jgi:two-component system alkaline phosphatase synthesis response regulator PhoP|uniref:Putative Response regulator receiver protein n=1 Tax=Crenothrix polyspora TaxID=360316 RepID=A0A1R4HAX4_9GAMM|nr:response regulator [Crenothrix polyspora]SJM93373.1 putative Response regulator receiver protein [Crenothrix polyspora]